MLANTRHPARSSLAGLLFLIGCGSHAVDTHHSPSVDRAPASQSSIENPLGGRAREVDPWLGAFQGEELSVVLRAGQDGAYRGELRRGDQTYPVQGAVKGGELHGMFKVGQDEFEFVARLSGRTLSLKSGGAAYSMEHGSTQARPAPHLVQMESFVHEIGFTFQHPAAWQTADATNGLALIPDDVKKDAQGEPLELFLVSGDAAEGVETAHDPVVAAYFDQQVSRWYPGLRRSGKTESLQSLIGEGAVYTYEGKVAGGVELRVMIYATIYEDLGIFLAHAASEEAFEARRPMARQMFSSFGWEKGRVDPDLVGHWYRTETSSSGYDPIAGSIGATTKTQYLFSEDGTVSYSSGTQFFGTVTGPGGSVSIDDPGAEANISRGTWSIDGDRLSMLWSGGGAETYEYVVFPHENSRALKLLVPGQETPEFFRPR